MSPKENPKDATYPWLRLLELEFDDAPKAGGHKGRGRPKSPFPRERIRMALTEEERVALDALVDFLSSHMGRYVRRGHLVAFLLFRLMNQLTQDDTLHLPEDVETFEELAKYLEDQKS